MRVFPGQANPVRPALSKRLLTEPSAAPILPSRSVGGNISSAVPAPQDAVARQPRSRSRASEPILVASWSRLDIRAPGSSYRFDLESI